MIIANWKMHKRADEAVKFIENLKKVLGEKKAYIAAPFPFIDACVKAAAGSNIEIGAQNLSEHESGAFTGEVSAPMLQSIGAKFALIGHSERRHIYGESDAIMKQKISLALSHNLLPVLCVGEQIKERENEKTESTLKRQLRAALENSNPEKLVIAYEPVWAIGTGKVASPEIAETAHQIIKQELSSMGISAKILYGGSVKPENISGLLKMATIDGALVGGASLEVKSYNALLEG